MSRARWSVPFVLFACLLLLVSLKERVARARGHSLEAPPLPAEPESQPLPPDLVAPSLSEPVLLRFAWPESGMARVTAQHRRDGESTSETFELRWRPLEGVGSIVEAYPLA